MQLKGVRAGIDDFLRINACNWVTRDVSWIVKTGLDCAEAYSLETLQDVRKILQQNSTQLDVLACCDVGAATSAITGNNASDGTKLLNIEDAVGDA